MSARLGLLAICILLGSERLFAAEVPCALVVSSVQACFSSAREFAYNALGQRVRVVEKLNGVVTWNITYLWVNGAIAEERDLTGATVAKRYFGVGMMIGATKYFFTADHLGSIREVTDNSGNIVSRFDYDPCGNRSQVSGTFDPGRGFTGHWHHSSGLVISWLRAYDPVLGRWLSRDPVEMTKFYHYTENSSINRLDILGGPNVQWHHVYPLYLGGMDGQVLLGLSHEQHRAVESFFAERGLGKGNAEAARVQWSGMSSR